MDAVFIIDLICLEICLGVVGAEMAIQYNTEGDGLETAIAIRDD